MADHTSEDAARLAYADITEAVGRYLHAIGFTQVTIGPASTRSFHPYDTHEFFVPFVALRSKDDESGKGRE